jgi:hypothetical protein
MLCIITELFREFPLTWMERHLERSQYRITNTKCFSILHSEESILRQIKVAQSKLDLMQNSSLRSGMQTYLTDLR